MSFLSPLVEPGFFSNGPVEVALSVGAIVAVVSGLVGTFTILRGQSFAGHSLADIGSAGGSGAFLLGVSPLYGFVAVNVLAAGAMELVVTRRPRARDVATGVVLGAALGVAALLLYLDTTTTSATGAAVTVLFGSVFTLSASILPEVSVFAVVATVVLALCYRPLLLSSASVELAEAAGIRVRLVATGYLLALALAVSLSAITIGAILSTALLIGPAAAAARLVRSPGKAMALSAVIALCCTVLGVLLSYDSYYWHRSHEAWPVSFFVVVLVLVSYAVASLVAGRRGRQGAEDASCRDDHELLAGGV